MLQPQFDLSHKLRGFEALARMKDKDGNIISPGEFIPVAEKVGLIDQVDGIVYRKSGKFIGDRRYRLSDLPWWVALGNADIKESRTRPGI